MNARIVVAVVAVAAILVAVFYLRGVDDPPEPTPPTPSGPVVGADSEVPVTEIDLPEVTLAVLEFGAELGTLGDDFAAALPRLQAGLAKVNQGPEGAPWLVVSGQGDDLTFSIAAPVPEDVAPRILKESGLSRHVMHGGGGLRVEIDASATGKAVIKADAILREAAVGQDQDQLGLRWFRPLPATDRVRFEAILDLRDEASIRDAQG